MSKVVAYTVIYGDEDFLITRELAKAKSWPSRDVVYLDGQEEDETGLISALSERPMDGSNTVVVVDRAEKIKLTKAFHAYLDTKGDDTSSILVAICRKAELPAAWDKVADRGRSIVHSKLKSWQDVEITKRIKKEAAVCGVSVDADVMTLLSKLYSTDISRVSNDLKKLALLVEPGGTANKELLLSICSKQLAMQPWDVAEAIGNRKRLEALRTTAALFKQEGDPVAVPIVFSLQKFVEQMLQAKTSGSPEILASNAGIHPYVAKQMIEKSNRYDFNFLLRQMQNLCKLELQVKGSAVSKQTLVELAVQELSSSGK